MIRQQPASELKSIIDSTVDSQTRLQFEFKVRQLSAFTDQVLIGCAGMFFGDPARDRPVLYCPIAWVLGLPAFKGSAIKDRLEVGLPPREN